MSFSGKGDEAGWFYYAADEMCRGSAKEARSQDDALWFGREAAGKK